MSDDPRMGTIIQQGFPGPVSGKYCVCIIGFPHDEGVRRNGGRVGAKNGPEYFRKMLHKIGTVKNPEFNLSIDDKVAIHDIGDVDPSLDLEAAHERLTSLVAEVVSAGHIPFVIGGGNDQSFPNWRGFAINDQQVDVINIDAHLDVRPLKEGQAHSGSPFRQILEHEHFKKTGSHFIEFAVQGEQCSQEHIDYIHSQPNTQVVWLSEARKHKYGPVGKFQTIFLEQYLKSVKARGTGNMFVSFDLDSVCSADAPGVSCPGTIGLTSQEALDICKFAGKNKACRMMDLSEFNPGIEDYRTARLVAFMFYYFCLGLCERPFK